MATEICAVCERKIAGHERAFLSLGQVVCESCNGQIQKRPGGEDMSAFVVLGVVGLLVLLGVFLGSSEEVKFHLLRWIGSILGIAILMGVLYVVIRKAVASGIADARKRRATESRLSAHQAGELHGANVGATKGKVV